MTFLSIWANSRSWTWNKQRGEEQWVSLSVLLLHTVRQSHPLIAHHALQVSDLVLRLVQKLLLVALLLQQQECFPVRIQQRAKSDPLSQNRAWLFSATFILKEVKVNADVSCVWSSPKQCERHLKGLNRSDELIRLTITTAPVIINDPLLFPLVHFTALPLYTHSFLPSLSSCLANSLSFSSCRLILFWYCLSLSLCCFSCCEWGNRHMSTHSVYTNLPFTHSYTSNWFITFIHQQLTLFRHCSSVSWQC